MHLSDCDVDNSEFKKLKIRKHGARRRIISHRTTKNGQYLHLKFTYPKSKDLPRLSALESQLVQRTTVSFNLMYYYGINCRFSNVTVNCVQS